jgi:hypothetical protein
MPGMVLGANRLTSRVEGILGVRHHKLESVVALERTFDSVGMRFTPSTLTVEGRSDFDSVYPYCDMRLCNARLIDATNYIVTAYQGEPGFTLTPPAPIDVMVETPPFYYKVTDTPTFRDTEMLVLRPTKGFTNLPEGYHVSPRHVQHIGAPLGYENAYIGAYTCDAAYRSISGGLSAVSQARPTMRTGCRNRGMVYSQYDIATWATLCLLYTIEVANLDSQLAVARGRADTTAQVARGDADGVLGHSGGGGTNRAMKYRNIENLWGNLWVWCDGINFNGNITHVNLNPATYADDTVNNYTQLIYTKAVADGFIRATGFDPAMPWLQIPTLSNGADGQFFSDHYWQAAGWRALLLGGHWSHAGQAGVFCFSSNSAASLVHTTLGCRLLALPPAA